MALLQSKHKERKEWVMRGNMIGMVRADRREVIVRESRPSKELVWLVNGGEVRKDGEEEGQSC